MPDELQEVTKTIDGKPRPAGDFLIVEDPEQVSTWHLPVKINGKVDHRLMGAAWAALHDGYRGNVYEGPGKEEAIRKLKALYADEDMEPPMGEYALGETAWVSVFGETTDRQALGLAFIQLGMVLLQGEPEDEPMEAAESDFAESAIGHALTLAEALPGEPGAMVPLHLNVALITPGWGNTRDNYYYPAEVVKRDANIFAGVKMFESDHRDHEKSTRTWVSTVREIAGFTDDGAPIARVSVHDRNFAERLLALNADGLLGKMECSILAGGTARKGFELDGRKGRQVESITQAESVDWVTRAGAGGRALALAENEPQEDKPMNEETRPDEIQESEQEESATFTEQEEPETPAPEMLAREKVHEALTKTNLPPVSVLKLAEAEYSDEAGLQEAIKAEVAEVKAKTNSGKPFGQGEGTAPPALLSEDEKTERFNNIMRQVGAREV